jgi:hypothetical protein
MENQFFKTVFGIMLLCLVLCVVQLLRLECGYEIANLLEEKNVIALSPRQVARQYILALKRKDYRIAYSYLIAQSQEKFPFAEFVAMNEKAMTEMDERKTWIAGVYVGMQIYEDPGSWGFLLIKADGKWRIVMNGGFPSFPFTWEEKCYCR